MTAQAIPLRAICTCASGAVRHARGLATSAVRLTNATASASASASTSSSSSATPAPLSISSAKPGTVLTGLSIYKDRADPIAGPDESYPAWLWSLTDLTADAAGGSSSASGAVSSRGDARVAAKREAKLARQAAAAQARADDRQAARAAVLAARAVERGEIAPSVAQGKGGATGSKVKELSADERDKLREAKWKNKVVEKQRELRKKNKAAIKASNFVKAS